MRKEPSPAKRCEKMRKERKRCEKSHVLWKKSRLCYIMHIELNLDHIDVIKNECQWVTNILMIFFLWETTFELDEKAVENMRKEPSFVWKEVQLKLVIIIIHILYVPLHVILSAEQCLFSYESTQKEITSHTDIRFFEDKLTKYESAWLIVSFSVDSFLHLFRPFFQLWIHFHMQNKTS